MPRSARKISQTGIYHIMLRGIDKRDIFLKNKDYLKFLDCISMTKEKVEFEIFAYCLMTNHVHLLIKTEVEEPGNIVRRIAGAYAQYSNIQNGRSGHLFQNRYRSEVVETDKYFLTVLRYIHQNPIKARITKNIKDYKWSSYMEYIENKIFLIEPELSLGYFKDLKSFIDFMEENNEDECMEFIEKKRWVDEELKDYISSFTNIETLNKISKNSRNKMIADIRSKTDASNRQLSKVLSIGREILNKAK